MYREKKMGISNCHVWLLETFAYQAHKFQTKGQVPHEETDLYGSM